MKIMERRGGADSAWADAVEGKHGRRKQQKQRRI
jgi:hypothetical protein